MGDYMYQNGFRECQAGLTREDISAAEKRLRLQFPRSLVDHYLYCNGGTPERQCWRRGEDWDPDCIRHFFSIRPIGVSADDEAEDDLEKVISLVGDELPKGFIPLADDWGGNFFCIDVATGGIYYYTIDTGDDQEYNKNFLASSLVEFIEGLIEEPDYLKA
ncbi:MAG TPA: SMI1/KNR4 family protein [Blastocatellia bacterium]|nr:SMI1/KNR4 family protein [Blastocatellia bacterium]